MQVGLYEALSIRLYCALHASSRVDHQLVEDEFTVHHYERSRKCLEGNEIGRLKGLGVVTDVL